MGSPVTYHQKLVFCGKEKQCRKCLAGIGHGPYWYAYQSVGGRTIQKYIGKNLPDGVGVQTAPSADAAYVRLFTLGQVCLEIRARGGSGAWYPIADTIWHEPGGTLLGALASSPERVLTHEQAGELLGNENREPAIERLRQLLEPTPRTLRHHTLAARLVYVSTEQIRLAEQTRIWIDADAFEQVLEQALETGDSTVRKQLLEQAMALYGGDFWPRARQAAWCQARRESLHRRWTTLLLELVDLRGERGKRADLLSAIDLLNRLLMVDPTNEAAVQRLIICLTWLDRRGKALRVYERLVGLLEREYGAAPAEETRRLYDDVLRGKKPISLHSGFMEPHEVVQIGRMNQNTLVGREQVRKRLHALLLEAEQHRPQTRGDDQTRPSSLVIASSHHCHCVFLLGEAGIGKTRLAEEVGREASKRGWVVAWSQTYVQESGLPYRPWIETLRKVLLQGAWQHHAERNHSPLYQPLAALLPELRDTTPEASPPPMMTHEQEQLALWEAVRAFLTTLSEGAPILIVLDDLQWADSGSCQLLAYLARHLYDQPVMIVGTCREDELGAGQRSLFMSLQYEGSAESISLGPLSDEQITDLVSQMNPTLFLPESVVQHIRTCASGNPLFAEELMRTHTTATDSLPASITAVLEHRLDRLTSECQQLLGLAAVLGSSFEFHALQAMVAPAGIRGENGGNAILDRLEEALQAGILSEEGIGMRITYRFWHPLMVSHLYEKLSAARRASLHRRAAEVLRQLYQGREEERAATIVFHLERGGAASSQIAHYAEMAGDFAYKLSAYPEAEYHYRLALEQAEASPPDTLEQQLHLAFLVERLGECVMIQGSYGEARQFYERVLEVCTSAAWQKDRYGAQVVALVWCEIGQSWRYEGDHPQAWRCCGYSEQALRAAGVVAGPAWASLRYQQSYLNWQQGRYQEARANAEIALTLFEGAHADQPGVHTVPTSRIQRTLAGDPVDLGRIHTLLAEIAAAAGHSRDALFHYSMALTIFEQADRQREIDSVCCNLGDLYLRQAEHELARSSLQRALAIAERIGDRATRCVALGNLGILARRYGNIVDAIAWYKQAITLAEQLADPDYISLWYAYLAAALCEQGHLHEAGMSIRRALVHGRESIPCLGFAQVTLGWMRITQGMTCGKADLDPTPGETVLQRPTRCRHSLMSARSILERALVHEGLEAETRTEGELALAYVALLLGDPERARTQAQEALEQAQQHEQKALHARAEQVLGTICMTQGEPGQAEAYFERALHFFHMSGMRLERARVLQSYGIACLQQQRAHPEEATMQRGLSYLQEARELFAECQDTPDLEAVEQFLSDHSIDTNK